MKSKILLWIIGHWKFLAAVMGILVMAYGAIQTTRAGKWYREHLRLEGQLEEQMKDQDKLFKEAAKERKERAMERAAERLKREELEARIQEAKREEKLAKAKLKAEKEKTATLPATELVSQINERIGEESSLTQAGLFLFTRTGANRTLDRFKDGEFCLSQYNKQKGTIADLKEKAASFAKSLAAAEAGEARNFEDWEDCRETLETANRDREALKKARSAAIWKARGEGAIGGGLAIFIFGKIFGLF